MTCTNSRARSSTLPTLKMVTSGSAAISSTARRRRCSISPSLPRARAARRWARISGRCRDRNHHDAGVGAAHRINHRTRYIGDHRAPGADIVIDRAVQCVAMAVRSQSTAYSPLRRDRRKTLRPTCSLSSKVEASRVTTRRGKTILPSSAQAARASPISESLPAAIESSSQSARKTPSQPHPQHARPFPKPHLRRTLHLRP
jgi:hypothetical protein